MAATAQRLADCFVRLLLCPLLGVPFHSCFTTAFTTSSLVSQHLAAHSFVALTCTSKALARPMLNVSSVFQLTAASQEVTTHTKQQMLCLPTTLFD